MDFDSSSQERVYIIRNILSTYLSAFAIGRLFYNYLDKFVNLFEAVYCVVLHIIVLYRILDNCMD
ncbi:hypothetical protein YTPLAS21_18870 [Candidatus Nitrosocosmicus sp.]|jgi:hypothetical protein|nr:hypothetical protein YTPLAS21_18870 [Candidatus Nitrosocosmicus sp.]